MGRVSRYVLRRPGLFLVGFLSLLLVGFLVNAVFVGYLEFSRLREHWRERFVVRAFFREGLSGEKMQEVEKEVATYPHVARVVFVSPEEAKKRFLERTGISPEHVGDISFPASLEVVPERIEDLVGIVSRLRENPSFEDVLYGGQEVERFLHLFRLFVRFSGGFLLAVLAFGVFVVVVITAFGVHLRRREVEVLSLVGATKGFSAAPFLLEGVLLGLGGGVGAYLLTSFLFLPFLRLAGEVFPGFLWVEVEELLLPILLLDLGGGLGIGVLGSALGYWGVRRRVR